MPVYDNKEYLVEAIESILSQTYRDFEFIIINDDPREDIHSILDHYCQIDERIQIYHQERQGLIASLNKGLQLAKGAYIARMDADDISLPGRLEKQVAFMESHNDVGVCGTWIKTIGCSPDCVWKYPVDDERIRCEMLFNSAFAHPSVIMRRNLLISLGGLLYDMQYKHAEDYELWLRSSKLTQFANINEVLLLHRLHSDNVGCKNQLEQEVSANKVRLNQLFLLGIHPSEKEFELHNSISLWRVQSTFNFVKEVDSWLRKIQSANAQRGIYPEPTLSRVLASRWFYVCNNARDLGLWKWRMFWRSQLIKESKFSLKQKIKFAVAYGLGNYGRD